MRAITQGITAVKQALVNFASFVGKSVENIWKAAASGVRVQIHTKIHTKSMHASRVQRAHIDMHPETLN